MQIPRVVVSSPNLAARLRLPCASTVVALVVLACGDDVRNEANVLIDRVRAIDIELPLEQRRERVAALRELAPRDDEVRRAREVCLELHSSLVDAETDQTRARQMFAMFRGGGVPSQRQRAEMERLLASSESATKRAQRHLASCTRLVADLDLRYGRQRRGSGSGSPR